MTTLTLEISAELYQRLSAEAQRAGRPVEKLVESWLAQHLPPASVSERERAREVLRAAGLLAEPTPDMIARAAQATMSLDEVQAALDRAGGKPLSEVVLEMRGPKI